MAVAVVFRRRWPLTTMAVVSATAVAQVVLFPTLVDPLPYDIAVLIAMYSVVKYGRRMRRRRTWRRAVVAVGIVIDGGPPSAAELAGLALWYVGVSGGVWLIALHDAQPPPLRRDSLEERAATLEREREHLARIAVAEERAAIARELHDVVAHSLAVMIVQADGARLRAGPRPGAGPAGARGRRRRPAGRRWRTCAGWSACCAAPPARRRTTRRRRRRPWTAARRPAGRTGPRAPG